MGNGEPTLVIVCGSVTAADDCDNVLTRTSITATLTDRLIELSRDDRPMLYRLPLLFTPQPEGGFTVTSPILPELVTEGDTLNEAFANAQDALAAVVERYSDEGRALPAGVVLDDASAVIWTDALVEAS